MMKTSEIKNDTYLGPYDGNHRLQVGSIQLMVFQPNDEGPFWMSERQREENRQDKILPTQKEKTLVISELVQHLKNIGVTHPPKQDRAKLQKMCKDRNLPTTKTINNVKEGWAGKAKGAFQILYERGFINPSCQYSDYTWEGKKDEWGGIKKCTSIKHLVENLPDFQEQETLLQYHGRKLGVEVERSPKCHCEIAGEGIEYDWGAAKLYYRRMPHARKKRKANFHQLVHESTDGRDDGNLNKQTVRGGAKRVREYMLAYVAIDSERERLEANEDAPKFGHGLIQKVVKVFKRKKSHRSARDFDCVYISSITKKMRSEPYPTPQINS